MADVHLMARSQVQLKGHRSVGGMRASVYNSMPIEGAKALADFMKVGLFTETQLCTESLSTDITIADHYVNVIYRIVQDLQSQPSREPCASTEKPCHEHAKHRLSCNLGMSQLHTCDAGLSEQTLISIVPAAQCLGASSLSNRVISAGEQDCIGLTCPCSCCPSGDAVSNGVASTHVRRQSDRCCQGCHLFLKQGEPGLLGSSA